jgi:phage tail-like protein
MPDDLFAGDEPYSATFKVKVDGVTIGRFEKVSGLEFTIDSEEVTEGGENGFVHKLPGRMRWPNIVMSRGVTQSDLFFDWAREGSGEKFEAFGNELDRFTVAITMTNRLGKELRTWELEGAFPVRWTGPSFSASDESPLTEEIEIAHHGFKATTHKK